MPPTLNPAYMNQVIEMVNRSPYLSLLGIRIREVKSGYAKVELELGEKHLQPFGSIHGGVSASLMDTAAYWAAYADLPEDAGFTSLDLSVTYLSMVKEGKLVAEGRAVKQGKSVCLTEVTVTDETGRLVAHGTSRLLVLQGRQAMPQALAHTGHAPLPPKFL
ncbi:MAG: PaaI family thioesterase [Clostridia bacterium]|nr:PaaI family thioesterase [Clostridia bacterium]